MTYTLRVLHIISILFSSNAFALDTGSFKFGSTATISDLDKSYIDSTKGNSSVKAYILFPGALVSFLRDGSEYGYFVAQVRIYEIEKKKLFYVHCFDIHREPTQTMRGIEPEYNQIEYVGSKRVKFSVLLEDRLVGYGVVDLSKGSFEFNQANQ